LVHGIPLISSFYFLFVDEFLIRGHDLLYPNLWVNTQIVYDSLESERNSK
jgi:hypothetical protein